MVRVVVPEQHQLGMACTSGRMSLCLLQVGGPQVLKRLKQTL